MTRLAMRLARCPMKSVLGDASKGRGGPFVGKTLGVLRLRRFYHLFPRRINDKQRLPEVSKEADERIEQLSLFQDSVADRKSSSATGQWTEQETESLKEMYEDGQSVADITKYLKRKEASVRSKIRQLSEYFQKRKMGPLYEGPQALSPELEDSIFRSRLSTIWKKLMTVSMTKEWKMVLSDPQSGGSWLPLIAEHTPRHVKSLLASHQPPTIARLESVGWSDTTAAGVCGWVLRPKGRPLAFDSECYLWLGSSSKYEDGLSNRKFHLKHPQPSDQHRAPLTDIVNLELNPSGAFITLLEVPFKDDSDEEIKKVRRLVVLAKSVFTIWLAAAKGCAAVAHAIPWEVNDIKYGGLSTYKLFKNIVDPAESRERSEKERENARTIESLLAGVQDLDT